MTVYNINRGIGWASSGVEYAQAYRAGIFRKAGIPARFIFTDHFRLENIAHFTRNIGFEDKEIIWLYTFFTDQPVEPSTYSFGELEASFGHQGWMREYADDHVKYVFADQNALVRAYYAHGTKDCIQRTEYVSRGNLIRRDCFFARKVFSEYFAPKDGHAEPYLRRYFNRDGSEAYTEILDGDSTVFRFPDRILYGKEQLISYMIEILNPGEDDVIIVDRAKEIGRAVFEHKNNARMGVVIHAEHYNDSRTDEHNVLWNNHYEYEFTNAQNIDFFVTSTEAQKIILEKQFRKYYGISPKIYAIPVGSLDRLTGSCDACQKKPHSLLTASRLASEKHIDWLVKAAVQAQKNIPDLTLDIYGKGGEETSLRKLIKEEGAEAFIRLCGHQNLAEIYPRYEAYASASTSEGFGLTLMEAVGAGLAMIGFRVNYGNVTFCEDGINGFLIPYSGEEEIQNAVNRLAEAMVKLFSLSEEERNRFSEESHRIAQPFLTEHVTGAWIRLLNEMGKREVRQ